MVSSKKKVYMGVPFPNAAFSDILCKEFRICLPGGLGNFSEDLFHRTYRNIKSYQYHAEAHSELCQTSKLELLAKIVNGFKLKKFHRRCL